MEEADALLHQAYDAYPTPTTRSRAFRAAAMAASAAGRHELALAWIDWAIREGEASPDRDRLLSETLAEAVAVARAAENPVLARAYVRRAAALAPGGVDRPAARAVAFERLGLVCPDVIGDSYLRTRAGIEETGVGMLATAAAGCDYEPIAGEGGFRVRAVRSFIELDRRIRELAEQGLDPREVDARQALGQRLTVLETRFETLFLPDGETARLGYARQSRPGVNDVAAYAYAAAARDGVFIAAEATDRVWDWPPEALGARAEAGLRGVLAADE